MDGEKQKKKEKILLVSSRNVSGKVKKISYFQADRSGFMLPAYRWVGTNGEFEIEMSGSEQG